ncbi:MAG: serine--tRNA ligase, partial [Myxococcales bacterium]|nr:serine--tRNA ligase [Myxococcales bacterium]
MLDLKAIRRDPDLYKASHASRGGDPADIDAVIALDEQRREAITQMEALRADRRQMSTQIGRAKDAEEREALKAKVAGFKADLQALEDQSRDLEAQTNAAVAALPNLVAADVPKGTTEDDNVVIATHGEIPAYDFQPKAHWELGLDHEGIDFDRGVKLAGSRFYVLRDQYARLQRALIFYLLDLHTTRGGYRELYLPFVVRGETLFASGQLPKFADNLYRDHQDDVWLVPTAEVPITNFHGDEILEAEQLPLRYCAYTPCFRR